MSKDHQKVVIEAIRKAFGKGAAGLLSAGAASSVSEVIPTGIQVLDHWALGVGGLPVGRASEWYSGEGVGKTHLILAMLAAAQRDGAMAMLLESENGLDEQRALHQGVDPDKLILLDKPDGAMGITMEDALAYLDVTLRAIPAGAPPILIAWDSLGATPTRRELEEGLDEKQGMDERARILGRAARVLGGLLVEKRAHLLIVNQVREKIGVLFGDNTTTPGGKAVKFMCSHREQIFPGKALKDKAGLHVGKVLTVLSVKNRFAQPYRKAQVRWMYEVGYDNMWSTINHAKAMKLIPDGAKGAKGYEAALAALGWPALEGVKEEADVVEDGPDPAGGTNPDFVPVDEK